MGQGQGAESGHGETPSGEDQETAQARGSDNAGPAGRTSAQSRGSGHRDSKKFGSYGNHGGNTNSASTSNANLQHMSSYGNGSRSNIQVQHMNSGSVMADRGVAPIVMQVGGSATSWAARNRELKMGATSDDVEIQRKLKGLLNKLSKDNYERIV